MKIPKTIIDDPLSQLQMMLLSADVVDCLYGKWKSKGVSRLYRHLKKNIRNGKKLVSVPFVQSKEFGLKPFLKKSAALAVCGVIEAKKGMDTELAQLCSFGFLLRRYGNLTWEVKEER